MVLWNVCVCVCVCVSVCVYVPYLSMFEINIDFCERFSLKYAEESFRNAVL
jgi:hypothetical protein